MKKRRVLKKWVEVVLAFILLASIVILAGESETYFISSKVISMVTLLSSGYLLVKYGREVK